MGYHYREFINNFSQVYKDGFSIFVAVLAAIFINIYTSKMNLNISDTFDFYLIFLFVIIAMIAILISVICTSIVFFVLTYGFGSIVFGIQFLSNKMYDKFGIISLTIVAFIILVVGYILTRLFAYPSFFWLLGLFLEFTALIPFAYTLTNKIKRNKPIPAYIR